MKRPRCIISLICLILLLCLITPPESRSHTFTYLGTTATIDITGMGDIIKVEQPEPIDHPNLWWITTSGMLAQYIPVGRTGSITMSLTLNATEGWRCSTSDIPCPPGNQVAGATLGFAHYIGLQYEALSFSFVPPGDDYSETTTYSLTDSGWPWYADADVAVWEGNDNPRYSLKFSFKVPDALFEQLEMNDFMLGGPGDNQFTEFDQGGAGSCSIQGLPVYSVNTSILSLTVEDTDFAYTSFGHDVALRRVWNMLPGRSGMFGNGWSFAYESSLKAFSYSTGGAAVSLGSGQVLSYTVAAKQGEGTGTVAVSYTCPDAPMKPRLTGIIDEATGTGYYLLRDSRDKLVRRYDYTGIDGITGQYLYRLASITDRNGNALTFSYAGNGRLSKLIDCSGRETAFSYDGSGRCTQFKTFDNATASFQYDGSGNLTGTTDFAGNLTAYAYDSEHYLTSITAAGKSAAFAYGVTDGRKHVATVTDALGRLWSYGFTAGGTQVTEPDNAIRSYTNSNGLTTAYTNQLGQTAYRTYNALGLPDTATDPLGRLSSFEYYASGDLKKFTDARGAVEQFSYDNDSNLTAMTDPLGNTWQFDYDAAGNPDTIITPLGRTKLFQYDGRGRLVKYTRPDNSIVSFTYDGHGNMTGITGPGGAVGNMAYDSAGLNPIAKTDPLGRTTTYAYDANRRLTRMTPPDGGPVDYGYSCCALSSVTDGNGHTTSYDRDDLLRLTSVTDPLGNATVLGYDGGGTLSSITDPLDNTLLISNDKARRTAAFENPLGGKINFTRDAGGNVLTLANELGHDYELRYDELGRLRLMGDPLGRQGPEVTRDAAGRVTASKNARGGTASFAYDADGRLTVKKYDGVTQAEFVWTAANHLASVTDSLGTTAFSRDAAGRVTGIDYPDTTNISMAYDNGSTITSLTYPGGITASYSYNGRGLTTAVAFGTASVSFTYDAAGNLIVEERSNGQDSSYGYDAANRLVSVRHAGGPSVLADIACSRDSAGRITSASGTWPLAPHYTSRAITTAYNGAGQLYYTNYDSFVHDEDGNLAAITGSRTVSASYDAENRLTAMTVNGAAKNYTYDGLGNRARIQTAAGTRNLHYDHLGRLLFETDGSGSLAAAYIYAGERLVASGTIAGGFVFYHQDKTGNTLALTDQSGNQAAAFAYSAWGAVVNQSGAGTTPFTYAGIFGVMDDGDGFFFMKNRTYDAAMGRFLQRDPIGFAGGANLYAYTRNNPVDAIDPRGTSDWQPPYAVPGAYNGVKPPPPPPDTETSRFVNHMFMGTYSEAENSWAFWFSDKATNFVDSNSFGFVYTLPKAVYYARKGDYAKSTYEGAKFCMGVGTGMPLLTLTLDVAGDVAGSDAMIPYWEGFFDKPAPPVRDDVPTDGSGKPLDVSEFVN